MPGAAGLHPKPLGKRRVRGDITHLYGIIGPFPSSSQRRRNEGCIRKHAISPCPDRGHHMRRSLGTPPQLQPHTMRQVPLERDINIAVNGCSGFATSTQKGPFTAMLISRSRGICLIGCFVPFRISWVRASSPFCRARTATVRRTRTSRPSQSSSSCPVQLEIRGDARET